VSCYALLACCIVGSALDPVPGVSDSTFLLHPPALTAAPTVDGIITDGEWAAAAVATNFIQYEPNRGQPSVVKTRALIGYDSLHLYVAFELWDAEPPAAQLTRRDADLQNDDAVVVLLDSHNDRQSAYYFMTNLLGTQTDGRVVNDGRTVDKTWDAPWSSAASRTEHGWSVELSIPFTSIKFDAGEDRTWGINFGRSLRRTLEMSFWAGPLEHPFRVSQGGQLAGLNVPPPLKRYQIIVYGLSKVHQDTVTGPTTGDLRYTMTPNAGGDLRYAITPEMSAYATINPDFATIEADQERVNLTRFELSLPEKRPFFLESAEYFRQRIRTFYSRRIPDIYGGGQVQGQAGPWTIAALATVAKGFQETPAATFGVGRLQRSVLGSSNVALQFANRNVRGSNRGSLGMDATLFFTRTLGMTAQAVKSWGDHTAGTWGYFIRPSFDSPTSHFHVRYTHLGENFREHVNAVGFVRDDDRRELDAALSHTFWLRSRSFERLSYRSNYNIYWSQTGLLRSWQIDQSLDLELTNRLNTNVAFAEEFKRFESDFQNRRLRIQVGYNTREFQSVRVAYQFGKNFGSDFWLLSAGAGYKITEQLSLEYDLERLVIEPDPDDASTWIHVVRANQFFTPDLYLRLFFQTNSAIDRNNIQAVFVYRYRPPFGTIQLAFQRGTAQFGERSVQGNTLFLKMTAVF
jgi:hypothetical protein